MCREEYLNIISDNVPINSEVVGDNSSVLNKSKEQNEFLRISNSSVSLHNIDTNVYNITNEHLISSSSALYGFQEIISSTNMASK